MLKIPLVSTLVATLFAMGMTIAQAEETRIDVRVISKAAKFIGTSMGGASVTIRDAATGELLAFGKTSGSTGDTNRIMRREHLHHDPVSTEDAAVFRASLELNEARQVEVTVRGPLAQRQATNSASVTQWVVPGKDITGGDGLTLEVPGFVVDVLNPPAHLVLSGLAATIEVKANVTMMCGCPIEPDGLWDANQLEVAAIVKRNGNKLKTVAMKYAGSTSQFIGNVIVKKPGAYEIMVYAYDQSNGNTGLDSTTVVVAEE